MCRVRCYNPPFLLHQEKLVKKLVLLCLVLTIISIPTIAQKTATTAPAASTQAQPQFSESLYDGMKWRLIGPYRGGRVLAVTGVPGQPNTYYFGAVAAVYGRRPMAA